MDIIDKKNIGTQLIKGTKYVFIDKASWNKEKKQTRHQRDYIGKLNEDGKFIPNKKYLDREKKEKGEKEAIKATIADRKFFGATHLLDCISVKLGVKEDLEKIFGVEQCNKIMSLAYFLVLEGESSMYRYEKFSKTHQLPFGEIITSQRISDIFTGITENDKSLFFQARTNRCFKNEYLAYDTTSISSYSELMKQIKYGKNKDYEPMAQLNLAMIFGEESKVPVYYRKLPGNISDVSTIRKLLVDMDFLGLKKVNFVLDRGFYSRDNINYLYRNKHKFIVGGRKSPIFIREYLEEIKMASKSFANYDIEHDIYCFSKEIKWEYPFLSRKGEKKTENKKMYMHGYYDGMRAEQEKKEFLKKLKYAEEAFLTDSCTEVQKTLINDFFEASNSTITTFKQDVIDARISDFGYFVLLSNHISDPKKVISIYRNKDVVEKTFCNLKNRLDMNRTRVSSEESLEGNLFVQFIALIYVSYIHQVMTDTKLKKNYSMASMLDELDVIEVFNYNHKKNHYSEITKKQKEILAHFDVSL